MRIGILTGGGDCPGLNAVIRAVGRRSFDRGHEMVAVREGLARARRRDLRAARAQGHLRPPAARRHDPRHDEDEPDEGRGRRRGGARQLRGRAARRARGDRRRGHARGRSDPLPRPRLPGRRGAEDDRQRSLRHRLHLRLRHGGDDRDRGDRPAPHDRRVAQPRHGRGGDGSAHRLDRGDERHRGRCRRGPDPRAADHGRGCLPRSS